MKNPRVSIIIPTYNREKLILQALDSIFKQTFQDFEILVIDDASTDRTEQIIKDLNHSQIEYYKLKENSGQCIARNYGIKRAKGEFIAFLDSDDIWMPEKLDKQIKCFEKGPDRLGGIYCYSYQKYMISDETVLKDSGYFRGDIHDQFMRGFCPPTPSLFLVKKSALDSVNGFDEELVTFVDLDLWMRLSEKHDFDFVEEPLIVKYEQIGDQYVNNFEKRYKGYSLFFNKWEKKVNDRLGKKELLKLKQHIVYSMLDPLLYHPTKSFRKNIPKAIGLLLKVRSTRIRIYLKAIMILLFGEEILYKISRLRNGTSE